MKQKPKIVKTQNGEAINCRWKCVGEKLEAYGSTPESAYDMYQSLMYYIAHINVPEGERLRIGREVYDTNYADKIFNALDYSHIPYKYSDSCAPLTCKEKEHVKKHAGGSVSF